MAAVVATNLTASTATGVSSVSTSNVNPVPNQILLVAISNWIQSAGSPNTPTPTLSGWTFHQVAQTDFGGSGGNQQLITLFVAIGSGSGIINIDYAGQTQRNIGWTVDQFAYTPITGAGGANAIVQNTTEAAAASGYNLTLAAFSGINNATYVCTAKNAVNTIAPNQGSVLAFVTGPAWGHGSVFVNSNVTNPTGNFQGSGGDNVGAIAVEISFQSSGGFIGKFW